MATARLRSIAYVLCAGSLILTCLFASTAYAAPSDDKQAEADAAYAQLVEKQAILDETSNKYGEAVMAQEAAEAAVTESQAKIDDANARIAELQTRLSARAVYMYREGTISLIDVLLSSTSLSELITNLDYLNIMNQNDADLIQESKDLRAEVEEQKAILVQEQKEAAAKAEEAKQIMEEAQSVVDEVQAIYDSLSEEAAELLAEEEARNQSSSSSSESGVTEHNYDDSYEGRTDPDAVVARAMDYLGKAEYVWGSVAPGKFDCSGFVSYCLSGSYGRLGTTYTFINLPEISNPRPGDICVDITHCGIYIGGGQMIHCTSSANNVIITPVWDSMIYVRY